MIEDKERELAEINQTQDVVIDLLSNYRRAFIIGGAGTGKTWIAIKKAKRFAIEGKKVLYLCCNETLASSVKKIVSEEKVDCFSLEMLAKTILLDHYDNVPLHDGVKEYSDAFSKVGNLPKYDLIVVDEAQDFSEDWAYSVNLLLKDNASLYVFYDENQNVFNRHFGDKFFIETEPFILRYNIRNTANIYKYTQEQTHLGLDTIANQIEGVEPDIRTCTRKAQVISFLDSIVNKLVNLEGVKPNKITVLLNKDIEDSALAGIEYVGNYKVSYDAFEKIDNSILVQKAQDFKGLESDIIVYINHTYMNQSMTEDVRSLEYTALTRARFYLYVINYEQNL